LAGVGKYLAFLSYDAAAVTVLTAIKSGLLRPLGRSVETGTMRQITGFFG